MAGELDGKRVAVFTAPEGVERMSSQFPDVPVQAESGASTLVVIANGIASQPVTVTVSGKPAPFAISWPSLPGPMKSSFSRGTAIISPTARCGNWAVTPPGRGTKRRIAVSRAEPLAAHQAWRPLLTVTQLAANTPG